MKKRTIFLFLIILFCSCSANQALAKEKKPKDDKLEAQIEKSEKIFIIETYNQLIQNSGPIGLILGVILGKSTGLISDDHELLTANVTIKVKGKKCDRKCKKKLEDLKKKNPNLTIIYEK